MIHPTALVHARASIAPDVSVGPYAVIGEHVKIGGGSSIGAHAVITGHTRIGTNNRIYQFVSLGDAPQDKKYQGEPTRLEIGDGNVIREFCTFNTGTALDAGVTRIGDNNWIMAYVHIAHDCQVGNNTVFANCATIAGHVHVGDYAILGAFTVAHQFCRIGAHSITAMGTVTFKDIPPYITAAGNDASPHGINAEGLKRRNFPPATLLQLKNAYKTLYKAKLTLDEAKAELAKQAQACPELKLMLDFLENSKRGIIR